MASSGIRDQVAIIGMGCTRFGELWDKGVDDLLTEAATEAAASAGMSIHDIDAFWLGTMTSGVCGVTLSRPLKLDYKPVTRVENYCATGSEAFRNACYAVASGAYDLAMAVGVEKLKDTGYSGLTGIRAVGDGTDPGLSSPAAFSLSPPVIGVIIDFDGGGRFRCELTDARPDELSIGDRVSMTFRRVWTAQGVHNYFWKARPLAGRGE